MQRRCAQLLERVDKNRRGTLGGGVGVSETAGADSPVMQAAVGEVQR